MTTEIAKRNMTFPQMLDTYKAEIARALPKHLSADRMCRIALTEFRKNPKLANCDPKSVFAAIIQSSQLGLEVGLMGEASLVPFKGECQLIPGFTGLMKLARNTGKVKDIYAHEVRENDTFELTFGLDRSLKHIPLSGKGGFPADDDERGPVVGYYAVGVLIDGSTTFQAMSIQDVNKIRDNSAGYKNAMKYKSQTTWLEYPIEMGKKTVIRRLCKYLPKSPELAAAIALDSVSEVSGKQNLTVQDVLDGTWAPDYSDQSEALDVDFEEKPSVDELFTIQFEKQVADAGVSFSELDRFVQEVAKKHKMTVESAKESAIKEHAKFFKAFEKDLAKQGKAEKSGSQAPPNGPKHEPYEPERPPILCPAQKKGVYPAECEECDGRKADGCSAYDDYGFEMAQKATPE